MASLLERPLSQLACGVQPPRQSALLIVGIALTPAASLGRSSDVRAVGFRGGLLNFRVSLAADIDSRPREI